jgi:hypothetical protein
MLPDRNSCDLIAHHHHSDGYARRVRKGKVGSGIFDVPHTGLGGRREGLRSWRQCSRQG